MDQAVRRNDKFLMWIDAVGGYWTCLGDAVVLGQAGPAGGIDIPILGDVSARHAVIRREGGEYVIEALRKTRIDGRRVEPLALLRDGCTITLGDAVCMTFRRPHPLSTTARLDFATRHRTQPSCDAVLLMAETCVLGPAASSHVVCRELRQDVVIYRQEGRLLCRASGRLEVDGTTCESPARLGLRSHVRGDRFAFGLEPLET